MIEGVHVFEAVPGQEKLTVVVPWKSGDTEIKSEVTPRVEGQYLNAHCVSILPWDQAMTETLAWEEMADM